MFPWELWALVQARRQASRQVCSATALPVYRSIPRRPRPPRSRRNWTVAAGFRKPVPRRKRRGFRPLVRNCTEPSITSRVIPYRRRAHRSASRPCADCGFRRPNVPRPSVSVITARQRGPEFYHARLAQALHERRRLKSWPIPVRKNIFGPDMRLLLIQRFKSCRPRMVPAVGRSASEYGYGARCRCWTVCPSFDGPSGHTVSSWSAYRGSCASLASSAYASARTGSWLAAFSMPPVV